MASSPTAAVIAFIRDLSIAGDDEAHSCAEVFAEGGVSDGPPESDEHDREAGISRTGVRLLTSYGWKSRVSSRGRRTCSGNRLIPTPSSAPVAGWVAKRGRSVLR